MNASIFRHAAAPLVLAAALNGCCGQDCSGLGLAGADQEGTIFLTQRLPQDVVMEALYTGSVLQDEQGCLRTETDNGALVIWPYGFTLDARGDGLHVQDAGGRSIGRIGGTIRMGGGYVPASSATYLSEADRALADAHCPSTSYWIVGDTDLDG